uniref:Germin-like protein n=2 Tax=Noccaea caerulescens TaxID=107243 RepID=A0A1J3CD91_NOCCA
MATSMTHLFVTVLLVAAHTAFAETTMLQDLCVADLKGPKVNGYPCKDPSQVTPEDFYFIGLAQAASTSNSSMGSAVTGANVEKIPGLNTMGVSISRIDYAPGGLNPPHLHPRASEAIFVLEGRIFVGFLTTTGKLISKYLNKGDVFVFPRALLHFQQNPNNAPASVIAAFDSQLPGTQVVGLSLFGANPPIPDDLLAKAFGMGPQEIQKVKGKFPPKK